VKPTTCYVAFPSRQVEGIRREQGLPLLLEVSLVRVIGLSILSTGPCACRSLCWLPESLGKAQGCVHGDPLLPMGTH
jgi:hypothetical protein